MGVMRGRTRMLLAGFALGVLVLAGLAHVARSGVWNRIAGFMRGRSTRVDVSSPAVVDRIRQLARLETVVFSMDKIVEGERQSAYLPNFLAGDKLLLIAHGEVTAGVDLDQLKAQDVTIEGESAVVQLPAPEVLSTRIDNARTRIYSRTTGLLVSADPNLESEARQAAEDQIEKAARADGLLDKAKQNARTSVTALLVGLGFRTVEVD